MLEAMVIILLLVIFWRLWVALGVAFLALILLLAVGIGVYLAPGQVLTAAGAAVTAVLGWAWLSKWKAAKRAAVQAEIVRTRKAEAEAAETRRVAEARRPIDDFIAEAKAGRVARREAARKEREEVERRARKPPPPPHVPDWIG